MSSPWLWLVTAASLAGVVLNIRKHRICFVLWTATSATWCVVDATHDLPQQAAIQGVYFVLSIVGLWHWRPRPVESTS